MKHGNKFLLMLLVPMMILGACKKKIDFEYDNRPNQLHITNSSTRLINLIGFREIQIGDKKLSSFLAPDNEGYYGGPGSMRLTNYFPETGQLSTVYNLPTEFIGADGFIRNIELSSLSTKDAAPKKGPFDIKDNGRIPTDYYVARTGRGYTDTLVKVDRNISSPSNPANFKVRILNLGTDVDHFGKQGKMTLTWADGTSINSKTSDISRFQYSDYIEIPYGTYQLKVITEDGRELPHKAVGSPITINILNPVTGTLMGIGTGSPGTAGFNDIWKTYAPLKTYQPGGVYTIVIGNITGYNEASPGTNGETLAIITNCFQVINDISEPVNTTFSRVQGVNTIAGKQVKWLVDGTEIGSTEFTKYTPYSSLITGKHLVKVTDMQNSLLAESTIHFSPGDNISLWAYEQKDGKAGLTISNNNLSGFYSTPVNGNDGSYAALRDAYPHWIKFFNFCPDLEEVTFTSNNGVLFGADGSKHLQYSQPKVNDIYGRMQINFNNDILVYQSKNSVLPGNWLSNIPALNSTGFIKNINLYKTPNKPNSEAGIYTVALVGKLNATGNDKAKMIIIKHNQ